MTATQTSPYLPGKPLILSRLPAQTWFTLEEVAAHSGWSRSHIRNRVEAGDLPAQKFQRPEAARSGARGTHKSYQVHVDDLVFFIINHSNGKYTEEKIFSDAATIVRSWPAWMRREMVKYLTRSLTPTGSPEAGGAPSGKVAAQA